MNRQRKIANIVLGVVAVLGLAWSTDVSLEATPPSGVTFTVLSRATVPAFDAERRFRVLNDETNGHNNSNHWKGHGRRTWKIALEATRMVDVVTVLFTVQPGGHSGWHTHPGPAVFTVSAGTLTMYDGDDPGCRPQPFPAGTGSIEADTSGHTHLLRNETSKWPTPSSLSSSRSVPRSAPTCRIRVTARSDALTIGEGASKRPRWRRCGMFAAAPGVGVTRLDRLTK